MKHGVKHTCFKCECKFYDLNKDPVVCPKCGEDQADKPSKKGGANIHGGRGRKKKLAPDDDLPDDEEDEDGFQDFSQLDDGSFIDLQEIEI